MFASSLWACWMLMWTFGSHLSSITTVDSQSCFWTRFMDFVYDWWFKRYRWRYWEYSSCIGKKRSKTPRHNTIIVFSVAFSDNPTNSDYMSNIYSGSGTRSVLTFCPRGTTKASNTMMNAGFFCFLRVSRILMTGFHLSQSRLLFASRHRSIFFQTEEVQRLSSLLFLTLFFSLICTTSLLRSTL